MSFEIERISPESGASYGSDSQGAAQSTSHLGGRSVEPLSIKKLDFYSLAARIARFTGAIFIILLSIPFLGTPLLFKEIQATIYSFFNDECTFKLPSQALTPAEFEDLTLSLLPQVGSSFTLPFANIDTTENSKAPPIDRIQELLQVFIRDTRRNLPIFIDGTNLKMIIDDLPAQEAANIERGLTPLTEERFKELKLYTLAKKICKSDDLNKIADFLGLLHQGTFTQIQSSLWGCFARFEESPISSWQLLSVLTESKAIADCTSGNIIPAPFQFFEQEKSQKIDSERNTYQMSLDATYIDGQSDDPYSQLSEIALRVTVTCDMKTNKGEITFTRIANPN